MLAREPERRERRLRAPRHAARGPRLRLEQRGDGQLWVLCDKREIPAFVRPCFPWSQPTRFVSLRDYEEEEVGFVSELGDLDRPSQQALEAALTAAGFVLEIARIESIEEEIEIRAWRVLTHQGPRSFQTARDEWPRELPGGGLLVRDVAGDLFHIPDPARLDPESRDRLWAVAD